MFATCLLAALLTCQQDERPYHYVPVMPRRAAVGSGLWASPGDPTPAAVHVFAMLELRKAIKADDVIGQRELLESLRVVLLEPGTALKVIEYQEMPIFSATTRFCAYEVRVLDGKYAGRKLLVAESHVAWKIYDRLTPRDRARIRAREKEEKRVEEQAKMKTKIKENTEERARWKAKMQAEFQAEFLPEVKKMEGK